MDAPSLAPLIYYLRPPSPKLDEDLQSTISWYNECEKLIARHVSGGGGFAGNRILANDMLLPMFASNLHAATIGQSGCYWAGVCYAIYLS